MLSSLTIAILARMHVLILLRVNGNKGDGHYQIGRLV